MPTGRPAREAVARRFARLPIRHKLLALVLLPLAVVLPLLGLILLWWSGAAFDRMLVTKVRADLAVAQGYFERVQADVGTSAAMVAGSHALARQLDQGGDVAALLAQMRQRQQLDFIVLRPVRPADDAAAADRALGLPLPEGDHTGLVVLPAAALAPLDAALAARAPVPLLPTRNAAPTPRTTEPRALLLLATRAVRGDDGRVRAWVQAGLLLNRNLGFIDHVNAIVYPEGSLPFGSQGTATLFLDDVRISTNVRLFGGAQHERAIGTRVSQTVRDAVLGQGHTWLDRAFVVDQWYVSGYQPLADLQGRRVGMLYVGFLERPFTWVKYGALAAVGAVFFAVMVAAAWVSLRLARQIFAPLERMEATMARFEAGTADARVGPVAVDDEIGRLAAHLDHLLDTVARHTGELTRWNAALDAKVAERTAALQQAQGLLVHSEKMAAVGLLTAGVAHEVNNPLAVIQGNLDLLRELLGPQAAPVQAELKLIDQQIERIRLIVTGLLQFARPGEYASGDLDHQAVRLDKLLDDCLVLVRPQLQRARIQVQRDDRATRAAAVHRPELQQVVVNLLVNAAQAMPDGGTLQLATRDEGEAQVRLEVADAGPGLPADLLDRPFQPFASRKPNGTGLGLWISRTLLERHGGEILAANRGPEDGGRGARVAVRLRAAAAGPAAGQAPGVHQAGDGAAPPTR